MPISPSGRPASSDLPAKGAENPPEVPDHELIRIIGQGSYGTVWLARNIMGTYRAVKVVYRSSFDNDRPYDREFHGIQKFEPISRSHESQVDILHIGRNDVKGYFFYVMELADDACSGQPTAPVQPSRSSVHDLHSERLSLQSHLSNVGPSQQSSSSISRTTVLAPSTPLSPIPSWEDSPSPIAWMWE